MIMIITVNDYSENMKLFLFHSKVEKHSISLMYQGFTGFYDVFHLGKTM